MSMLCFFPWLRIEERFAVGGFQLIPYERESYDAPHAKELGLVTESHRERPDHPIRGATLLRMGDHGIVDDLADEERSDAFDFAEMLALAGLSARRYFEFQGYCNRDNFDLVIQAFDEPGRGVARVTRRRDGSTTRLVPRKYDRVTCPDHVGLERVSVDLPFLEALNKASGSDIADQVFEAAVTFNMANTDAPGMSPHVELVLTASAFERALGCHGGKEAALADEFLRLLQPRRKVAQATCSRAAGKLSSATSVRETWIRDLYRLRGDLAHGKVSPRYPSVWAMHEHLLLASFVFPLVLKSRLAEAKVYSLTGADRIAMDAFEQLACTPDLMPPADPSRTSWPWNDVLAHVESEQLVANAVELLERLDSEE